MKKKLKSAITALLPLVLLSACETGHSSIQPDVIMYEREIMQKAAEEMEGGYCPILTNVMMPDYSVMRDQARIR